jgi:hypothetical protein
MTDGRHTGTGRSVSPEQIAAAVQALVGPWLGFEQRHRRQEGYRALAGGLLRDGLDVATVEAVVAALVEATEDDEADKRVALVANTAAKIRDGKKATGWPSLIRLLEAEGESLVENVKAVLGIGVIAVYDYRDELNQLLYQVLRHEPKRFTQRRPDGKGGWLYKLDGVRRVLYRLPELLAAPPGRLVFIVEGEKDVNDLIAVLGLIATCNPMGAGKWRPEFNEFLRGRHVCILPDNDDPGREHARDVARNLSGVAASVKILMLPDLPDGGDVFDWLLAGGHADKLLSLAEAAAPLDDQATAATAATPASPPRCPDPPWPDPLPEEAYHGLAGEIVRVIEPATEADPAGLLFQILIGFGNLACRQAHFVAEADKHYLNEFVVLVGKTAKARKGTSWGHVLRLLAVAEEEWATDRIQSGLSSGEGLIWAVRDPIMKRERVKEKDQPVRYEEVEADPGVPDKRLLVYEPEYANVLKQTERQGNTLSVILRQAWESSNLRSLTKNSPARATGAHVSLIGHITTEELGRYLSTTEMANGYGNRHLWVCVQRSKSLPDGGKVRVEQMEPLQTRLAEARTFARGCGEMRRDDEAREVWHSVYDALSEGQPGAWRRHAGPGGGPCDAPGLPVRSPRPVGRHPGGAPAGSAGPVALRRAVRLPHLRRCDGRSGC